MGAANQSLNQQAAAEQGFTEAIRLNPNFFEAHYNLGNILKAQGKLAAAVESYHCALAIKPDSVVIHLNLGNALKAQGKLAAAAESYQRALAIKPNDATVHYNIGNTFQEQGDLAAAVESYHRALAIKPDYMEAHHNLGITFFEQGKLEAAMESYHRALVIKPDDAAIHYNLGNAFKEQGKLAEAVESYNRALAIKPNHVSAQSSKLHQQAHMCDWRMIAESAVVAATLGIEETNAIVPFTTLSMEDHPARQRLRSEVWAGKQYKQRPLALPARPHIQPKKLKVGYFSADFHDHATFYLISGLFEHHDTARFDIYVYSYGSSQQDDVRDKLHQWVALFSDIRELSDKAVVDLARSHQLDIAIDLKGYTGKTRSALFAYRLAPIQINYLGYPGTMGAPFIDYLITDKVLIPNEQRSHYSEALIYLPDSYQPNDNQRQIATTTTTCSDFGLTDDAFVFCCFNNNYKITPQEFDIWIRLLKQIDNSVLWLLSSNQWAETNLRKEAEKRDISGERLVFADKLPLAEHLARHKHADLFIDTFNYNAHTTASDALWAGLPVVTKAGKQFAARVAASLLHAVGLPELITDNEADYEALVLELATDTDRLAELKQKLAQQKLAQPLFNTERYTRQLEDGYNQVYARYFDGQAPADIVIKENAS